MGVNRNLIAIGFMLMLGWPQNMDAQRRRSRSDNQPSQAVQTPAWAVDSLVKASAREETVVDTLLPLSQIVSLNDRIDALFLLPFREDRLPLRDSVLIDSLNPDEKASKRIQVIDTAGLIRQIELRRDMQTALEMYYGISFALDSAQVLGLEVNARFIDTQLNPNYVADFARNDTVPTDLVVGPISARVARAYLQARRDTMIPMFAPFMTPEKGLKGRIYFGTTVADQMREKMLNYALSQYRGERVFLIADSGQEQAKIAVKKVFEEAYDVRLVNDLAVEQLSEFRDSIVDSLIPNWAFLETTQSGLAASLISILNGINAEPKKSMRLFSTTPSVVYFSNQVNPIHLSSLLFAYPEIYGRPTMDFVSSFKQRFGFSPSVTTTRAFDITMDAFYRVLIARMANHPNASEAVIEKQVYAGSDIDYAPYGMNAYQNVAYRLKWVRDLSFSALDTTLAPEVFDPWPEIPDTWLADRLLAIEKMRYPERFDEDGQRIEENRMD